MFQKPYRKIYVLFCAVLTVLLASATQTRRHFALVSETPQNKAPQSSITPPTTSDTLKPRFNVATTTVQQEDEHPHSADLRQPENLKTEVYYDEVAGVYRLGTKLGDDFLETPFLMSPEQYNEWEMQRSLRSYFRDKNAEEYKAKIISSIKGFRQNINLNLTQNLIKKNLLLVLSIVSIVYLLLL